MQQIPGIDRRIVLRLPADGWEQLTTIATEESRTMPAQLRHVVLSWLKEYNALEAEAVSSAEYSDADPFFTGDA